jgi:hypothetical protein
MIQTINSFLAISPFYPFFSFSLEGKRTLGWSRESLLSLLVRVLFQTFIHFSRWNCYIHMEFNRRWSHVWS